VLCVCFARPPPQGRYCVPRLFPRDPSFAMGPGLADRFGWRFSPLRKVARRSSWLSIAHLGFVPRNARLLLGSPWSGTHPHQHPQYRVTLSPAGPEIVRSHYLNSRPERPCHLPLIVRLTGVFRIHGISLLREDDAAPTGSFPQSIRPGFTGTDLRFALWLMGATGTGRLPHSIAGIAPVDDRPGSEKSIRGGCPAGY